MISEWQLELPANPSKATRQFDYDTISDVILHVRYTAREGGGLLRDGAVDNLKTAIDEAQAAGSVRLFSVRHEFPTEWAKFQANPPVPTSATSSRSSLREEHYPFWSQGRLNSVKRVDLVARSTADSIPPSLVVFDKADQNDPTSDTLPRDAELGKLLHGQLTNIDLPSSPVSELKFFFVDRQLGDMWVAITWGRDSYGPHRSSPESHFGAGSPLAATTPAATNFAISTSV